MRKSLQYYVNDIISLRFCERYRQGISSYSGERRLAVTLRPLFLTHYLLGPSKDSLFEGLDPAFHTFAQRLNLHLPSPVALVPFGSYTAQAELPGGHLLAVTEGRGQR